MAPQSIGDRRDGKQRQGDQRQQDLRRQENRDIGLLAAAARQVQELDTQFEAEPPDGFAIPRPRDALPVGDEQHEPIRNIEALDVEPHAAI